MKKSIIIVLFFCLLAKYSSSQISLAGPDRLIYLTQGNSTYLNGHESVGTTYQWTKITDVAPPQAGFPFDSATIVSPTSAVSQLTGLIQGVWYYQLAATTGGNTVYDTCIVRVDAQPPPVGGVLVANVPIQDENWVKLTNDRSDTTNDIGYTGVNKYMNPLNGKWLYFERARSNQAMIDSSRGKLYNTLEDGYHRSGEIFDRTQVTPIGNFHLDSNKTYVIELKFYFPQSIKNNMDSAQNWYSAAISGMHASDAHSGSGGLGFKRAYVYCTDTQTLDSANNVFKTNEIYLYSTSSDSVGQAHTLRLTVREGKGYPGQDAFIKYELDGVKLYERDTGQVGRTWQTTYLKMTGLYDYGERLVSPDSLARGRKFSLVTEMMNVWEVPNEAPPINYGESLLIHGNLKLN